MNDLKKIPLFLRKTIFEKVFKIATYSNLTKEEKMLYDLDLKKRWDDYSALETATREGEKKGAEETRIAFIRNLIVKMDFSDSQIVEVGNVSLELVQRVRASIEKRK